MINNRVFEALACGAIVVSDNYTALHALASEVLLLVDEGPEVAVYLDKVTTQPTWAARHREASRDFVLHGNNSISHL